MGLTFFGTKNNSLIKFCKITYILHLLVLICRYSVCCMVYVTYTRAFIPTPFKALSLGERLYNTFNQLNNNVFTNDIKC